MTEEITMTTVIERIGEPHSWVKHDREGWTVCRNCGMVRNYNRETGCCGRLPAVLPRTSDRVGPRVTIVASCHGCDHARSTALLDDSGSEYSCAHAAAPPDDRRTHDETPDWCPFLALAIEVEFRACKERIAREYAERWPDDTDASSLG